MLSAHLIKKLRDFTLDVTLSVHNGEVLVLIGENGAGKSTILNLLAGLLSPDDGEIILCDRQLYAHAAGISLPPEEREIGYVFQNYALFPHLTVFENVAFGLKMRKVPTDDITARVREILTDLGIQELAGVKPGRLSGGQQQRVALARALITRPRLLLLDEPLAALDKRARDTIRQELRETLVRMHLPTILVTHSLRDARVLGDSVIALASGTVEGQGVPGDLAESHCNHWFSGLND